MLYGDLLIERQRAKSFARSNSMLAIILVDKLIFRSYNNRVARNQNGFGLFPQKREITEIPYSRKSAANIKSHFFLIFFDFFFFFASTLVDTKEWHVSITYCNLLCIRFDVLPSSVQKFNETL